MARDQRKGRIAGAARDLARRVRAARAFNETVTGATLSGSRWAARLSASLERHSLRAGELRVPLPNGRELALWSETGDAMTSLVWSRGWDSFDPAAAGPWFALAVEARVVLDVGANIGLFSLLAAHANPAAECFAFEPLPRTRAALDRNIRCNRPLRVTTVPVAVSSQEGTLELHSDPAEIHDAMASTRAVHPRRGPLPERCTVPAVTLDGWARSAGVGHVDLVKIDVEYHEPHVLAGMQGILSRDRPDVIVEVLDDEVAAAVSETAARIGYEHYLLTLEGPIATPSILAHPSCLNHLLTARPNYEPQILWRY